MFFVASLCVLGLVSALPPRLRLVTPGVPDAGAPPRLPRLCLFRPSGPHDRPPLNVFNAITKGPLAKAVSVTAPAAASGEGVRPPNTDARPAPSMPAGHQPLVPTLCVFDKSPSVLTSLPLMYQVYGDTVRKMQKDPVVANCTEFSCVEFNSDAVASPFTPVAEYNPKPLLEVAGGTNLGLATARALDVLEARLAELRTRGVPVKRILVIVLSDFQSFDSLAVLAERLHPLEQRNKNLAVLPIGFGDVNAEVMNTFSSKRQGLLLKSEGGVPCYKPLFDWIDGVIGVFSRSHPDEAVDLPPTDGWRQL